MKLSRKLTGLLAVALLAFMVTGAVGQDQGGRGGVGTDHDKGCAIPSQS